ncbi:unnamed protein product [Cuscuta epithymum]|uniref:Uncharacterized protein n=1 Tax=Cuscuta epithymum TaxID=186058 RepID=A0AAV0EV54_9ASTE|nr:unnamed protein product [Cuscuta epithymum]
MAKNVTQRPLIFQDENLDVYSKTVTGDISVSSKQSVVKKGGTGLKGRGALHDITNKSSAQPKPSQKKSFSHKKKLLFKDDEVNIAEEAFLHDHKKCLKAQQAAKTLDLLDLGFPERDPLYSIEISDLKPEDSNMSGCNRRGYPELEELSIPEDSLWFESSSTWNSPPSSLKGCDSPLSIALEFEQVEFKMKEESDFSV